MSTKQIEKSTTEIQIPDDVNVSLKGSMLHVQGPLGHVYKNFKKIPVVIEVDDKKILVKQTGNRKKTLCYTQYSKINNSNTLRRCCRWIYNENESCLFPFSNHS